MIWKAIGILAFSSVALLAYTRVDRLPNVCQSDPIDSRHFNWPAKASEVLGQPERLERCGGRDVLEFRITVEPSFTPPGSITIRRTGAGSSLMTIRWIEQIKVADITDCPSGLLSEPVVYFNDEPQLICQLPQVEERSIGASDTDRLLNWLSRDEFWEADPFEDQWGNDGCTTWVEGLSGWRYHSVTRWACGTEAPSEVVDLLCSTKLRTLIDFRSSEWPPRC